MGQVHVAVRTGNMAGDLFRDCIMSPDFRRWTLLAPESERVCVYVLVCAWEGKDEAHE